MACNILRFKDASDGSIRWGVVDGHSVYPMRGEYETTAEFINSGREEAFTLARNVTNQKDSAQALEAVEVLSPVTKPCQVLCQGANYRQHMIESGMNPDSKSFNMFFNKSAACLNSAHGDIRRPAHVKLLDYEVELGLVLGADLGQACEIGEKDLPTHIAGLVIANDISARDIQVPQMQFFKGKSYRSFCPVGPYLCLLEAGDFAHLNALQLSLSVNGEMRQSDSTENLVFKPAETLTELSQIADLNCGDLILTGTPAGCAMQAPSAAVAKLAGLLPERKKWDLFIGMQAKKSAYLQPGDVVEARIVSSYGTIDLGLQRNRVVAG